MPRALGRLRRLPRAISARCGSLGEVGRQPVELVSAAGYRLHGHLHRSKRAQGSVPGVLLCPGMDSPGSVFDGGASPVNADELASRGFAVLHFDPAGRGRSWGNEDYGGEEHQDGVRVALGYLLGLPGVDPDRSGVLSISFGVAMAVGALAGHPEPGPAWLLDWEGPSDRETITAGGRFMDVAAGHSMDDDQWWVPREPVRHVGRLRCRYFRFQAARDHAQPGEFRHAIRMVTAAARGGAPWFQLNDHEPCQVPAFPSWYPSGGRAANRLIMEKVIALASLPPLERSPRSAP